MELKKKSIIKRQQKTVEGENKLEFFYVDSINNEQIPSFLKIEIVSVDIRPLSSFSNDTVYVTKIMIPSYPDDLIAMKMKG
jgi:hypothetical protein